MNHESLICDISDWQSAFDARAYRRAGRAAIMIKASEGTGYAGASRHAERAAAAHAAGLRVLHYAFLEGGDGAAQAAALLAATERVWRPGDRLVADVEVGSAVGAVEGWARACRAAGHTGLLLYTYRGFCGSWLRAAAPHFAGAIIADYGRRQLPTLRDRVAARPLRLVGRQFTDGTEGARPHRCAGIAGPVDCTRLTTWGRRLIMA